MAGKRLPGSVFQARLKLPSDHICNQNEIYFQIVNDLFAFLFADEVKFDLLHDVLHFLEDETEHAVWFAAVRGFKKLRSYYLGTDTLSLIDVSTFILKIFLVIVEHYWAFLITSGIE